MEALAQAGWGEFASRPIPTSFSPRVLITNLNFMDPDIELEGHMDEIDQDFGDSANPLWSLYGKIAKENDTANLDDITSGMDSLLIFVRPLSSTLSLS